MGMVHGVQYTFVVHQTRSGKRFILRTFDGRLTRGNRWKTYTEAGKTQTFTTAKEAEQLGLAWVEERQAQDALKVSV